MSETRPNDGCRICKSSFKLKFGSLTGKQFYFSSQNLFKLSQRKDSFGIVLADVCRQVGLVLSQDPEVFSDRVCNPYGRKIVSLGHLFKLVKVATFPTIRGTPIKGTKHTLATPEKASPSWRKAKLVRVNSPEVKTPSQMRPDKKSRKSLAFTGESRPSSENEDEMLRRLNVDDLPRTGLQVNVVYVNPSGNVIVRIPRDEQTRTLVKNLACENWRDVSSAILKHGELAPE